MIFGIDDLYLVINQKFNLSEIILESRLPRTQLA